MKILFSGFTLVLFSVLLLTLHALESKPKKHTLEKWKPLSLTSHVTSFSHVGDVKSNILSTPKLDKRAKGRGHIPWTAEEEERLMKLREEGKSWNEVLEYFPERSRQGLKGMYTIITGSKVPKTESKPFTAEEEEIILKLRVRGESWTEIAKQLPGRKKGAIRNHYFYLRWDPERVPAGARRERYTEEEKKLLVKLRKMNLSWSETSRHFPGRSENALRRLYVGLRSDKADAPEPWTHEDEDRLLEALKEGKPTREIGELLGRTMPAVRQKVLLLKKSGRIQVGQYGTRFPRFTTADFELMREKREEGLTWREISRRYFPGRRETSPAHNYRRYLHRKARKENQSSEEE